MPNKPGENEPKDPAKPSPEAAPAQGQASAPAGAPARAPAAPTGVAARVQETATEAQQAGLNIADLRSFAQDPTVENHDKAAALLRKTGPLAVDGIVYTLDGAGRVQGGQPQRSNAPVPETERVGFGRRSVDTP